MDIHIVMTKNVILILLGLLVSTSFPSIAQISVTFDALPYQNYSNPVSGLERSEVFSNATKIDISYPFVLRPDKTVLQVGLSWERRRFEFYAGDTEAASFNLKPSAYVRMILSFGG